MPKRALSVKSHKGGFTSKRVKAKRVYAIARRTPMYKKLSGDLVRYFKRQCLDSVLSASVAGGVLALDYQGNATRWMAFSAATADTAYSYTGASYCQFGGALNLQVTDMVSSSDFTGLFRQFQLNKAVIKYEMITCDSASAVVGGPPAVAYYNTIPEVTTVLDQSDGSVLPSYLNAITYSNAATHHLVNNKPAFVSIPLRPSLAVSGSAGPIVGAFIDPSNMWIDSVNAQTTYFFGHKNWFRGISASTNAIEHLIRVTVTVYGAFRQPY